MLAIYLASISVISVAESAIGVGKTTGLSPPCRSDLADHLLRTELQNPSESGQLREFRVDRFLPEQRTFPTPLPAENYSMGSRVLENTRQLGSTADHLEESESFSKGIRRIVPCGPP